MNPSMIGTLLAKDAQLYFKNRFFALITILSLVAYAVIYYVMPARVEETLSIAVSGMTALPQPFVTELAEQGLVMVEQPSEEAVRSAVQAGDYPFGVVFSARFMQQLAAGTPGDLRVYFGGDLPEELRDAYRLLLTELGYLLKGQPLQLEAETEILGVDMAGSAVAPRDRIVPLVAVVLLLTETLGLASLISSEIEAGTIEALLTTPLRAEGLFVSKAIFGIGLAFSQVLLLLVVLGGLRTQPLLVLFTLLLGSLLVTGIAFLVGTVARGFMGVMAWGTAAMIVLMLPGLDVLLPGLLSGWVRGIPTYYLVNTVYRVMNLGEGWAAVSSNLLVLALVSVLFLALGSLALRRRYQ